MGKLTFYGALLGEVALVVDLDDGALPLAVKVYVLDHVCGCAREESGLVVDGGSCFEGSRESLRELAG